MSKFIEFKYGYFKKCENKKTVEKKIDVKEFINKAGLIAVFESEKKMPGKRFIYFCPNEPNATFQRYFATTPGEIEEIDGKLLIETMHSIYTFKLDEDGVSKSDKDLLVLNFITNFSS